MDVDLLVVGGGMAGLGAAKTAADLGKKALVGAAQLLATGRGPRVDGLELEKVGVVEAEEKGIEHVTSTLPFAKVGPAVVVGKGEGSCCG